VTSTAKPATDAMIASLNKTAQEYLDRTRPATGEDLYAANITAWMGERMPGVLARLAAVEAEVEKAHLDAYEAAVAGIKLHACWRSARRRANRHGYLLASRQETAKQAPAKALREAAAELRDFHSEYTAAELLDRRADALVPPAVR
jgi:hypothetical protein